MVYPCGKEIAIVGRFRLKKGGELKPRLPGGVEAQRILLEQEGHSVVAKEKNLVVMGYEESLVAL